MSGVADGFEVFLVNHVFFALYDLIFCVDKIKYSPAASNSTLLKKLLLLD